MSLSAFSTLYCHFTAFGTAIYLSPIVFEGQWGTQHGDFHT